MYPHINTDCYVSDYANHILLVYFIYCIGTQIQISQLMAEYVLYIRHTSNIQGPVVQSVVSLTSSLRVISLTVLVDSRYNILIFFAEKM